MRRLRWLVLAALGGACASDVTEDGPTVVPVDAPLATSTGTCVDRLEGETVAAVSPEGDLWLVSGDQLRAVDIWGTPTNFSVPFSGVAYAQAWDDRSLTALSDGTLWQVTPARSEALELPAAMGTPQRFCGNPSRDRESFVVAGGQLYHRTAGEWWLWTPGGETGFGGVDWLGALDPSCTDSDDALWLGTNPGELWRVRPEGAGPIEMAQEWNTDWTRADADASLGVVLWSGDQLLSGGPVWHTAQFEAGAVQVASAAGGDLWVVAGGALYRQRAGQWNRVDIGSSLGSAEIDSGTALYAHAAGGVWIASGSRLCHRATSELLRVRGLLPLAHIGGAPLDLTLLTAAGRIEVQRDGTTVASLDSSDAFGRRDFTFDPGGTGWHTLAFHGSAESLSRELRYRVIPEREVSWAQDVQPVFHNYCAGGACHGPSPSGGRPDLSSYDAWRDRAARIRERVVRGEMPPTDPRLSPDLVELVLQWMDGGMKP